MRSTPSANLWRAGDMGDAGWRADKARKALAVLRDATRLDLADCTCLDVGCGDGLMTRALADAFDFTLGVELVLEDVLRAGGLQGDGLRFVAGSGEALPLADGSVDVAICAQVYEHVRRSERLFAELWRVLRPGGICFFSGPNRLYPIELHYRLPFVHWLPIGWTRWLLDRLGRSAEPLIRSKTPWGLKRSLAAFQMQDWTPAMVRDPERYHVADELAGLTWLRRLPEALLRPLLLLAPNLNLVLIKPRNGGGSVA